jgi:hypothetical protein
MAEAMPIARPRILMIENPLFLIKFLKAIFK